MAASTPGSSSPVRSSFAGDPEMAELVQLFVSEMPTRIRSIEQALGAGSADELRRAAHQLKGAAGGYGFQVIGTSAGKLEAMLQGVSSEAMSSKLDSLRKEVDVLTDLCRRASSK